MFLGTIFANVAGDICRYRQQHWAGGGETFANVASDICTCHPYIAPKPFHTRLLFLGLSDGKDGDICIAGDTVTKRYGNLEKYLTWLDQCHPLNVAGDIDLERHLGMSAHQYRSDNLQGAFTLGDISKCRSQRGHHDDIVISPATLAQMSPSVKPPLRTGLLVQL